MSVRFKVKAVYITTSPATGTNHDGNPYSNEQFPSGTVYAEDSEGNLFFKVQNDFPLPTTKELKQIYKSKHFYRDYWRHIASAREAPFTKALLNAEKIQIA